MAIFVDNQTYVPFKALRRGRLWIVAFFKINLKNRFRNLNTSDILSKSSQLKMSEK